MHIKTRVNFLHISVCLLEDIHNFQSTDDRCRSSFRVVMAENSYIDSSHKPTLDQLSKLTRNCNDCKNL